MLLTIPDLLRPEQILRFRQALEAARWDDGRATAGSVAARAKQNQQLAADDPAGIELGREVLEALQAQPQFVSAALPHRIVPPRFNCYRDGGHYGAHVDGAVLGVPGTGQRVRTDVSATLFLCEPGEYDGGELVIEDTFGTHAVKLPAGHLLLYPGTSLHRVTPVTRGARLASFFWVQSLVRDDTHRRLLYELDTAIQALGAALPGNPQLARLLGIYHNLLRCWSET